MDLPTSIPPPIPLNLAKGLFLCPGPYFLPLQQPAEDPGSFRWQTKLYPNGDYSEKELILQDAMRDFFSSVLDIVLAFC